MVRVIVVRVGLCGQLVREELLLQTDRVAVDERQCLVLMDRRELFLVLLW